MIEKAQLRSVIEQAWIDTLSHPKLSRQAEDKDDGACHARRSKIWWDNLAKNLERFATTEKQSPVHSKRTPGVQGGEFLFDLVVHCSQSNKPFTGKRLWAVESEFAKSNQAVDRDLAKLFWADVENRLFICSDSGRLKMFRDMSGWEPLTRGTLFCCRLPHPERWCVNLNCKITLLQFLDAEWQIVSQSDR